MTTPPGRDRSRESVINAALSRLLTERVGLGAAAETLHHGLRPDIVVRLPESPLVVETEVEPASVEADALARLGMEINGRTVQNAFAVTAPAALRSVSHRHLSERMVASTLAWLEWRVELLILTLGSSVRF